MKKRPALALLFDLDGTLADSAGDIGFSLNFTLQTLGREPLTPADVKRYVGDGVRQLLSRSAGALTDAEMAKALELFMPHYLEHCADTTALYPGVRETLDAFKSKSLAVVTNKPARHTEKTLKKLGIEGLFGAVVGGDSLPQRKPSPEPLWDALRRLGVSPADAVMVGDSGVDIQAARAAGVGAAGVTYGFRPKEELAGADFILDRFADLKEIIL